LLDIQPATQDRSLLDAMAVVSKHRHTRRDELPDSVDLGFASQRWQNFVIKRRSEPLSSFPEPPQGEAAVQFSGATSRRSS
jgi:hypothetical protein